MIGNRHIMTPQKNRTAWFLGLMLCLLSLAAVKVEAQHVVPLPYGKSDRLAVTIDSVRLAVPADTSRYHLLFRYAVSGDPLPQYERLLLRPQLRSGDSLRAFPPLEVRGRQGGYCEVVAAADWMRSASLCLVAERRDARGAVVTSELVFLRAPVPEYVKYKDADERHEETHHLQGRAYLSFPVNQSEVLDHFRDNGRELARLRRTIDSIDRDSSVVIAQIGIKGYASPEGSYANNKRLARERTESLARYIAERTHIDPHLLHTDYEPEDWAGLRTYVDTASIIVHRAGLLSIIDRKGDPDAKLADILLTYPTDYTVLKAFAFPLLRHTDYRIDYTLKSITYTAGAEHTDTLYRLPLDPLTVDWPLASWTDEGGGPMPRRELLAVKTNLLFYGVYLPGYDRWAPIPNIAIEYYPKGGHFTLGASFDMPWWQDYDAHKYFQLRNYQLEGRYYLRSSSRANGAYGAGRQKPAFYGLYFSAYAHAGLFGICFDADRGWVGEGAGAGLGAGYVVPLSRNGHWRLELGVQGGFFRAKYDPYQFENPVNPSYRDGLYYYKWTQKPELFKKRQYRWNWLGPTRVGVTLSYDLIYRKSSQGAHGANGASEPSTLSKERRAHE